MPHASRAPDRSGFTPSLYKILTIACAMFCASTAGAVVLAWEFDLQILKDILPQPAMHPLTAAGLTTTGLALALMTAGDGRTLRRLALNLTAATAAIGVAILVRHENGAPPAAAFELILAATALAMAQSSTKTAWMTGLVASLTGLLLAFFAVLMLADNEERVWDGLGLRALDLHASAKFLLLFFCLAGAQRIESLRWRFALLGVLLLAPLTGAMVYFAHVEREAALQGAREHVTDLAALMAENETDVMERARFIVLHLAGLQSVQNGEAACAEDLAVFSKLNSWMTSIVTSDLSGATVCANKPEFMSVNIADRAYFRAVVEREEFLVSELLIGKISKKPRLFISMPLYRDGRMSGVITAGVDIMIFQRLFAFNRSAKGLTAMILDRTGTVLSHEPQRPELIGRSLIHLPIVRRAVAEFFGKGDARDQDGRERLFAFRMLTEANGVLMIGFNKETIAKEIDAALADRLLLISLIVAIAMGAALLGGEAFIFRPLRMLVTTARRLEAGDLDARPPLRGGGEVAALARALERMAQSVAERSAKLAQTEALFRGVFEHSIDALFVCRVEADGAVRIEALNPAARVLRPHDEPVVGDASQIRLSDALTPEAAARIEDGARRAVAFRQMTRFEEEDSLERGGASWEVVQAPLGSVGGGGARVFVSMRDITQRKTVERLKNEFVATVSHELRTPLTSIAGSLGLLMGGAAGALPDKTRRLIGIAHSNSQRLVRLINDILDIEKIESGRATFDMKPLSLRALAGSVVEANRGFGESYGVSIGLDPGPDATTRGDQDRLIQVLTNLLSNAVKFSPRGAHVSLSLTLRGESARLSVRDRGPGIPEEFKRRIFSKFAQADGSDSRRKDGTGLGLSIAKEIVERHGGAVSFDTAVGEGTSFHVDLPVAAKPMDAAADEACALICEDDPDAARMFAEILGQIGLRADIVGSAEEALTRVAERTYRIFLIDLRLPGKDGVSLIRDLRAREATRAAPIVVVSAYAESGRECVGSNCLNVWDWLQKPVAPDALIACVRAALARSRSRRPAILHLEDDGDVLQVVGAALAESADVTPTQTLEEARAALSCKRFDLAILDMDLGERSGLELLPDLRDRHGRVTPVILFSAEEAAPSVSARVSAALTKSRVSMDALAQTVRRLIDDENESKGDPS